MIQFVLEICFVVKGLQNVMLRKVQGTLLVALKNVLNKDWKSLKEKKNYQVEYPTA